MAIRRASIERIDISSARARGLLARVRPKLADEEFRELKALVETLVYLAELVAHTNASIRRVRALLFGTGSTEKTRDVLTRAELPEAPRAGDRAADGGMPTDPDRPPAGPADQRRSEGHRRGHGRQGAAALTGARRITIPHPSLTAGDPCPACDGGKVYAVREPTVLVRFVGQAPVGATVYALEKLRCHLCGTIFTAPPPAGVGPAKYDARTAAMIALLKYGSGVPFYRLARLQAQVGIPLPASTQWEIVERLAAQLRPVQAELIRHAANGAVLYNDDTSMTVLSLLESSPPATPGSTAADDDVSPTRTGVFTSGIVATTHDGHRVALYLTGRRHAGENLAAVLAHRTTGLEPPIIMCDALSRNVPKDFVVVLANCLCHGRRQVVDVAPNFPEESRFILETFREVYRVDAQARESDLTPEARLTCHQTYSRPLMDTLHVWLAAQLAEHRVEPNSGLGQAMRYLRRHWTPLTRFLEVPGAPLDSNLVERALKRAILHRKASLFYKTRNGADVGDLFMALVHTCELNGIVALDYLTVLQQHLDALQAVPGAWLPWTYGDTLRQLSTTFAASA